MVNIISRGGVFCKSFPVILVLCLAGVLLAGCGGGGAASAEDEGQLAINLNLSAANAGRSALRSARALDWATVSGEATISIESNSFSDSRTVTVSPGTQRSVTFHAVPVGINITISASFTDEQTDTTYTGSATKTVTSGPNVITLNLHEQTAAGYTDADFAGATIVKSDTISIFYQKVNFPSGAIDLDDPALSYHWDVEVTSAGGVATFTGGPPDSSATATLNLNSGEANFGVKNAEGLDIGFNCAGSIVGARPITVKIKCTVSYNGVVKATPQKTIPTNELPSSWR